MAEKNKAAAPEKKKKPSFFAGLGKRFAKWFRELRSELKKVVWPTPKQIINNTLIVLLVVVVSAVVVWGFDELAAMGVSLLISIGG